MSYNRILLWLVTLIAAGTAVYFLRMAEVPSKPLGWAALLILLLLNVYYYFFSNDWIKSRRGKKTNRDSEKS
ncbi:MAG: hypothetical protein ACTHZ7_13815 [Sphingobacterium sp.]